MEGFDEVNDPRIARGYADVLLPARLRCGPRTPGRTRRGTTLSTDFEIQNVRVLASQVVLDSALVESFNRVLLSGRSLVFNGVAEHNVTVARAFTKLMGVFVTFWDDAGSKMGQESQMQLGSLQYPHNPMKVRSTSTSSPSSRVLTTTRCATSTSAAWATCATASLPAFPPSACPRCR